MIFKSIKWRLQIWYGLILVLVLGGFGITAYQLDRMHVFYQINAELNWRFGIVAGALHRRPPPRGSNADGQPFDRPPPDRPTDDGPPGQNVRPPVKFNLPPEAAGLFDTNDPNNFYYIIQSRDGKEIARSANVPPLEINPPANIQSNPSDILRGIDKTLPSGERIQIGCHIAPTLKELRLMALMLSGFGSIILIFGLAGGWWFVGRALWPISEISSTAIQISSGDLSQRISIAETESEHGQLAAVLNSTFARLETAFAQQKQFVSDAAHELRTPVSVILTQTQTALNREREAVDYKQTVEACQRAAQRMRKLISALLELARLDAGQEILKRLRFDFSKTVTDCVELIRPLAYERRVKIIAELLPLEISGDSERLAQVVTNLLTNAIQYNHDGGEARIKLESQNGLAVLTIADSGQGIAPEDLPRIFERFYRADKSRSSGNAGLGLAISKAIVEAHSGTIEVSSEENIGTNFTVRLPV